MFKGLENSNLIHQPINEPNGMLRAEALPDRKPEVRKIQVSALSVPCHPIPLRNLHDFLLCVCNSAPEWERRSALDALSRTWRCGRFKRSSTRRRRESVISDSKTKTLRVYPKKCIGMTVTGEDIRCFIDEFPINLNQTCTSSVIRFCVFVDSATSTCGPSLEKKGRHLLYVACFQTVF